MDKMDIASIYPLTATQQGMLFHALANPATTAYVEQVWRRLPHCDAALFARAWEQVVSHYDALRTGIHWEAVDRPVQIVRRTAALAPQLHDWRALAPHEREERLLSMLQADRQRGFELDCPPLMRLHLVAWSADEDLFVWTYHHVMLDGWSAFRVIDEVLAAYAALGDGRPFEPAGPPAFKPYVNWLRARDAAGDESFWRDYLRGFNAATPLNLALDAPWRCDGERGPQTVTLDAAPGMMDALRELARRQRVTVATVVQAAWAWMLSRLSSENDVVFGTTVSGRPPELPDCERMVGLFINTLPTRVRMRPEQTVAGLLQQIQASERERLEHSHSPLVDIQGWSSLPQGQPLFESLLVVESFVGSAHFSLDQLHVVQETNYAIALVVEPNRELRVRALFDAGRISPRSMRALLRRFEAALATMARRSDAALADLPFTLPDEAAAQARWNRTATTYPAREPITAGFVRQALTDPGATAVTDGVLRLGYGELLQRADRLAGALQARGARRGDVVAMLFEPSIDMIVAAAGIVRAGCTYAPLDPKHPRERQAGILAELRAPLFVSHRAAAAGLDVAADCRGLWLEEALEERAPRRDPGPVEATDMVYLMHTSGSTGKPKAAGVYQHSFVNLMQWWNAEFGLGRDDRVLLVNKISFDLLQKNIWGALCTGGEVHVVPDVRYDPVRVRHWIREHGITWMNCTPSMAYALLECGHDDADFASLRYLMLGGEPVQKARFARWQAAPGCRTEIVNTYGPTECADLCGVHRFAAAEFAQPDVPVTVGRALPNIRLYVLDDQWRALPPYTIGEIVIGGASVGTGYLNNAAMSAEKFLPDFLGGEPGARLYRTGDTGLMGEDGRVYVRGRVDFQVKLRGQRVELEEIDAIARTCPWVEEAVTVLADGDRLVCYVALRAEAPEGWPRELQAWLARQLSPGLVPAAYVRLDALPLNDNGKVNRAALPPFDAAHLLAGGARVAPRTETEAKLAQIWAAVLGTDAFGVTDDFFELGGHSLSLTQVFSRIPKVLGARVALGDLFEHPTIEAQARLIDDGGPSDDASPAIVARERPAELPLSSSQARLWFLQQYEPDNPAYNVPSVLRFAGVEGAQVRHALEVLVARHEPLRTRFVRVRDGNPCQQVMDGIPLDWRAVHLSSLDDAERAARIAELAAEEAGRPFDLAGAPPARFLWVQGAGGQGLLLTTLHHIIVDGWSMQVFERELRAVCTAQAEGRPHALAPLPIQYADYALWQRDWLAGPDPARQLDAWRAALADAPSVVNLPFDRQRAPRRDHRGGVVRHTLPAALAARVRAAAERARTTPYVVLMAAFQAFVHRVADQEDFTVGTPVANRHRQETEGLVGLFVNTLVLRARFAPGDDFAALLARTRAEVLAAQDRQDLPFETLVERLAGERHPALNPLFQVLFSVQEAYEDTSLVPENAWVSRFDLQVIYNETGDALRGAWEYAADLFDRATVERFTAQFACLLDDVLADVHKPISHLSLGAGMELPMQPGQYPREASIGTLFAEIAHRHGDRVALRCGGETRTYAELDAEARRVAAALRALGAAPGARVGVSLSRSPRLIAAVLGIVMAGGAYVPLDPAYPAERLAWMASDAGLMLVVCDAAHAPLWRERGIAAADVEELRVSGPLLDAPSADGMDTLAYITYTSGSTGRPKGVAVPHRGVVRLVRGTDYCPLGPDTVMLECAPVAFDALTFEIWGALLNGGQLVIYPHDTIDILQLAALIRERGVNTAFLTSGLFNEWTALLHGPTGLGWLLTGGEAINADAVRRLIAADPDVALVHVYGPTENTTFSTFQRLARDDDPRRPVPIGRPITHSSAAVMDAAGRRLPPGVPGELWVGGDGVALGYWGQSGLSAERFVADPADPARQMYRTGDIVRLDGEGRLLFLGRRDGQVKLRGFRIELEEVRAALAGLPGVAAAAVAIREQPQLGRQLCAWVVPAPGAAPDMAELRALMRQRAPAFMVPARLVPVPALPLNTNGKVDFGALLVPDDVPGDAVHAEPATDTERMLWEIWSRLLNTRAFGATDSFFDLGGHSLLAARAVAAIEQQFGQRVALRELFAGPTVRELALCLDLGKWHREGVAATAAVDGLEEIGVL